MNVRIPMLFLVIFCLGIVSAIRAQSPDAKIMALVEQQYQKNAPALAELYLHLHQNPEISFQERHTAARLTTELRAAGYEVTEGVGGYGVVAVLRNGKGKTVLVRADMDALPLEEQTGLAYSSKAHTRDEAGNEVPVAHACGHDIHMTTLVGTAHQLAALRAHWRGTVVLIAQPAEERASGAKAMLAAGLYERFPRPDYALALHCHAGLPVGTLGFTEGYAYANVDMLDITVYGVGGHGAAPHTTIDPIVLGMRIVMGLQTIVSREINPLEPAVVTVGAFHSGTKGNIISDRATMQLTLRSYTEDVRQQLITAIKRICKHTALSAGLPEHKLPEVIVRNESIPAVYNTPELTQRLRKLQQRLLGEDKVRLVPPAMVSEDFGLLGRTTPAVPICIYWLGTIAPRTIEEAQQAGTSLPSLHSPFYAPDYAPAIRTGVQTMTSSVIDLLMGK